MKSYQITEILNMTPTPRGIAAINPEVHKGSPGLSDFLKAYQNIQIQK